MIALAMGSQSDWETLTHSAAILKEFAVNYTAHVISAHRTPQRMMDFAQNAHLNGYQVIIAAAGGAAHLPGMIASRTLIPVVGVPVQSAALHGVDSLLSIVQMPGGVPVATMAIGKAGAVNAALYALQILALGDAEIAERLKAYRTSQEMMVLDQDRVVKSWSE